MPLYFVTPKIIFYWRSFLFILLIDANNFSKKYAGATDAFLNVFKNKVGNGCQHFPIGFIPPTICRFCISIL